MTVRGPLAGMTGALTGWLLQPTPGGMTLLEVVVVTGVSCAFGMLSSLSRVNDVRGRGAKFVLMNAGAVWIAALVIVLQARMGLAGCAMVGLGVGLGGTAVLEIIERGTIALAARMMGNQIVSRDEFHEELGRNRQRTQKAVSELRAKVRRKDVESEGE